MPKYTIRNGIIEALIGDRIGPRLLKTRRSSHVNNRIAVDEWMAADRVKSVLRACSEHEHVELELQSQCK